MKNYVLPVIFMLVCLGHSMHWSKDKNRLFDLEFIGQNFIEEAKAWTTTNGNFDGNKKTTQCSLASDIILGGPGIMNMNMGINGWFRSYSNLPNHTFVKVQMKIYPVDNWLDEEIGMQIESYSRSYWRFNQKTNSLALNDTCGSSVPDIPPLTAYVTIQHDSKKYRNLQIFVFTFTNRSSLDLSLGIREVIITFSNSTTDLTPSFCGVAPFLLSDNGCKCHPSLNEVNGTSGQCEFCDISCLSCNKPGPEGCTACRTGNHLTEDSKCVECAYPCLTCSGDAKFCTTCSTTNGSTPTLNGTCPIEPCPSPLTRIGYDCLSPCDDKNDYIYWFGQCSSDCIEPLVPEVFESYSVCSYPCLESEYLYWNGSCNSDCPTPLIISVNQTKKFCNLPSCSLNEFLSNEFLCLPCSSSCRTCSGSAEFCSTCQDQSTSIEGACSCPSPLIKSEFECLTSCNTNNHEYTYWNGDCGNDCQFPLKVNTLLSFSICEFPCLETDFLYWNGTCTSECVAPFRIDQLHDRNFCLFPCLEQEYLYWNNTCDIICPQPYKKEVDTFYNNYCNFPCDENKFFDLTREICLLECPVLYDEKTDEFNKTFCNFPCDKNDFLYWNKSCKSECVAPYKEESNKFCNYPCDEDEFFDLMTEVCLLECPKLYDEKTDEFNKTFCNFPCDKNDFLYWNKSCKSECVAPYKEESNKFCNYPCDENEFFDLTREICLLECPILYEEKTDEFNKTFCNFPCDKNDFLYWNKSCKSECVAPYKEESNKFCNYPCDENEFFDLTREICLLECPILYEEKTDEFNKTFCNFPCDKNDFLYWNKSCKSECVAPYKEESNKFCNYPCDENEFFDLITEVCLLECPKLYEEKTDEFNKTFCNFPCQISQFLYWNGTCANICPHPLIEKKINEKVKSCNYPCTDIQYLYSNGTCEDKCVPPFKIHITNDFKKFCVSTESLEETSISVKINGQITRLFYIEKTLNAVNEAWTSSSSHDFTLGPTWTFFGLNPFEQYSLDHWDTTSSCGCFKQVCGTDCQQGSQCHNTDNNDIPWICHPWSERKNYCWSIVSSAKKWFMSYSLTHISTIALTSYVGLDTNFVQPGFTITNKIADQNYAINAIIMDFTPRQNLDLQKSYLYAESEGRVITITEFEGLNNIPTIQADLKNSSCNSTHVSLPLTLLFNTNEKVMPFHSYIILRQAKLTKMTILSGINILSLDGVVEWNNQEVFHFLDPCNQQFLTLQKDPQGNFFVKLPASQRLANMESIICIAVQDQPHLPNDLVLYEIKIGTLTWTSSHRFTGILSKDYIRDLSVRLTTKVDPLVTLPQINVDVQFHIDVKPPLISISTSSPTTCKLYLSPSCTYSISTDTKLQYISKSIEDQCGYLYEKAAYNCEGLVGYFFPPANLTKTRIDNLIMLTTSIRNKTEIFSVSSKSHRDDFQRVYFWLIDWTWQNCLTKLLALFIVVSIISGMVILIIKFPKTKKSTAFSLQKNYNIVINPHNDETAHVVNALDNDDNNYEI